MKKKKKKQRKRKKPKRRQCIGDPPGSISDLKYIHVLLVSSINRSEREISRASLI
jgi:hypothetical protein